MKLFRFFSFTFVFIYASAHGQQSEAALSADEFAQCKDKFQTLAEQQGISAETREKIVDQLRLQPQVLVYDRRQPEFIKTFTEYFNGAISPWRLRKGAERYAEHKALLQKLQQEYGIPAQYLLAFWGLETNFGNNKGKMPILDSLATLACDKRRSAFFTEQLMLALKLLEREKLTSEVMQGSWAGAMGHTQFMPSAYLSYAKDGDGDGKMDLWNSEADALTSAAHFLQQLGWQPGLRWGREVQLPEQFDYSLAGKSQPQPLSFWVKKGVTKADGSRIPALTIPASLLLPAGHSGPAFLVYKNFDVILGWNNSEYYAIAVGHLADRLTGAGKLSKPLPDLPRYSLEQMQQLQQGLNQLGFDVGEADGILGPATRAGIRRFQLANELIADGYPSDMLLGKVTELANL